MEHHPVYVSMKKPIIMMLPVERKTGNNGGFVMLNQGVALVYTNND